MSEQESHTKRTEKRRELFKQQQQQMLQGYNLNSFKSSRSKKQKSTSKTAEKKIESHRQIKEGQSSRQNAHTGRNDAICSNQPTNDNKTLSKNQKEFAEILDQMSLNSSSKLQMMTANQKAEQSSKQTKDGRQNLNFSKSQTGLIRSLMKGQPPLDMKIHDASLTINSQNQAGKNALNSLLDKSDIHLQLVDDEQNRKQFEEENPYGDSQKLNMTDYQQRNRSKNQTDLRRRRSKPSPFERYEEIRFQCYELQQKLTQMTALVTQVAAKIGEGEGVNFERQTVEVPLDVIEQLATFTQEIGSEFSHVQSKWNENFDEQQRSNSKQRSKRKQMKKRLKSMENRSQQAVDYQKEFERSLQEITKVHNTHTNRMGLQLDEIENQVNSLKYTREFLNSKYENQLDKAYQEMVNFYENLEQADPKEIDSDNMSIEQVFFIRPTHQISQSIKQRSKSQLKLSHQLVSADQPSSYGPRSNSVAAQARTPNIVPKLQIERLQEKSPEPPRIINKNQKSQRGSARQYQQVSQRSSTRNTMAAAHSNPLPAKPKDKNTCPSGRASTRNQQVSHRGSARGTAQKQQKQSNSNQKQVTRRSEQKEQGEDFITNPVMVGAMQLPESKFDKQYEDDFEDANVTLDMNTDRLRQFPEDYAAINSIDNPDERIILKQVVFMKYERLLKKQAKLERKRKKKALKAQKEAMEKDKAKMGSAKKQAESSGAQGGELHYKPKSMIPTPTHKSSFGFGKFQNQQSSKGSLRGGMQHLSSNSSIGTKNVPKGLGMNERHEYNDNSQLTSRFSLHSALSALDTVEVKMAQQKYRPQDVNRTELLECEEDLVHGLKTATQTSLIRQYEEEFHNREVLRQQIKQEEKKLDYSSSLNSKISIAVKQMSQGSKQPDLLKNYHSNNSNPIYIHDSANQSMVSEILKDKRPRIPKPDQTSNQNSKKQLQPMDNNRSFNNASGMDQSGLNMSLDQPPDISNDHRRQLPDSMLFNYECNKAEVHSKPLLTMPDNYNPLTHPTEAGAQNTQAADETMASGHSQYQRYLEMNGAKEYQESPNVVRGSSKIHNESYINSEATPISQSNQDASKYDQQELDIDEFENIQSQIYFDHQGQFRQRLPLDVIQERQSEFSQSMITNAQRINTHRSMQSKNYHYNNMNQNVSKHQQSIHTALASNRLSDCHMQSSANRKNSSRGMQESFEKKTQDFANEEQYRSIMVRSSSVAQTHRNPDNSFIMNPNMHNASINEQQICIDGSLIHHSRNAHQKNSSSSKDQCSKKDGVQIFRQPSAGNYERERLLYFQNFELENGQKKNQKSKLQNNCQAIPPTGKQQAGKQGTENKLTSQNTRNNAFYQNKSNQQQTAQEQGAKYGVIQHQLSYRSHQNQIHGGESFRDIRDRSYFDESPAIFDQAENDGEQNPSVSRDRCPEEKNTVSSRQVENSIQVYRTDETGDTFSNQKFGQSMHTNMVMNSVPQSSCQSSNRDSRGKQSRVLRSKETRIDNQMDQRHPHTANQSHKALQLNSNHRQSELEKINENLKEELDLEARPLLFRSNSFVHLRDKEFYEMCLDDDEAAICEQNLFEALQLKIMCQSKQNGPSQPCETGHMLNSNVLLNRLSQKYQTQSKCPIDQSVDPIGQTPSLVDQNSSQQQTRGQRTFAKFLQDPTRLLASINDRQVQPYNNPANYLGTHLLTKSLDDGTLHLFNNMMNPNQYKKTLMIMCNLHNNCLHSANSGTLFTMHRSGYIGESNINAQIAQSFNNLTNLIRSRKEFINQSTRGVSGVINGLHGITTAADRQGVTIKHGDPGLKSLGGDPVNISNLLLGAKQQTAEQINVGQITIVEDEGKKLLDRKLYFEPTNNSASQDFKGRKLTSNQSRNQINGQIVTTSDFSNLQTKQLGIFQNRNSQNSNPKPTDSDAINIMQIIGKPTAQTKKMNQHTQVLQGNLRDQHEPHRMKSTPNQFKAGFNNDSSSNLLHSDKHRRVHDNQVNTSTDRLDAVNESKSTIKPGTVSSQNQTNFMNLLVGLKQIQRKTGGGSSQRSGSDLSIRGTDIKSATNFRTISQIDPQSNPQENLKKIIKLQQHKNSNQINLNAGFQKQSRVNPPKYAPAEGVPSSASPRISSSMASMNQDTSKSKSVPGGVQIKKAANLINKVKLILNESQKKVSNNETIKNFNTIAGNNNSMSLSTINQTQLSQRNQAALILGGASKNQRTNSSCMAPSRAAANGSTLFVKNKNSNVTTLSSARGSSQGPSGGSKPGFKHPALPNEQIFIDQNGKKFLKKKVSMKQSYQSAQPAQVAYIVNMNSQ